MSDRFYITTPIYYVNARPHLGHAYSTIVADVVSRFHSMKKQETFFLTGTDEHGDKIVAAAKTEGLTPRAYVDKISWLFQTLWPELNISNNAFIRTTDPAHMAVVEQILQKIRDNGDIYFSEYEGLYCFGCEKFYAESELTEGRCSDHQAVPELIRESNYFLRISKYQDWLISHIKDNPDFIRPERYRNEVLAFLKEPLEDLCISRPKSRLKWGVTLPFDNAYVVYVWVDALINYLSAVGWPNGALYKKFWPSVQHVVAKDILKFHGIFWPILLKSAGIPVYNHLNVHGYWNIDQSKMSKSIGNVVDPLELKNHYGRDAFRFYLMRDMVFGLDAGFSEAAMVKRINSDLANDLGNLFSRVVAMVHKYFDGVVPTVDKAVETELQLGMQAHAFKAVEAYDEAMEAFSFHKGMMAVWELISQLNKYIDVTTPWVLAKKKSTRKQLEAVLYNLLEGLRIISGLVYPVMPDTAVKMQQHLGMDPGRLFYALDRLRHWGLTEAGTRLPKSISLFPRIDTVRKPSADDAAGADTKLDLADIKPEITLDDLTKVDLRVATVVRAEGVPRAKTLLKLTVNLGREERTIVAGISTRYEPAALVGKQVVVVVNLKPAKLMGILSEGMLLAATDDSGPTLVTLDGAVKPGTPLS